MAEKIDQADAGLTASSSRLTGLFYGGQHQEAKKKDGDGPLAKVARDRYVFCFCVVVLWEVGVLMNGCFSNWQLEDYG